jgi:hypothetical protein
MEIANALQDEVIRRLGMVETEAKYTGNGVGVFYHARLASAKVGHVYVIHARSQMIQEDVAAVLAGEVIPMVEQDGYHAANEMKLLEHSISEFKAKLSTLIGARRKESRAVWEETKEAAKRTVGTALLKEMGLVDWAQATDEQHANRLSEHSALKNHTFKAVTAKSKPANALVESLGNGQVLAWSLEEKALVAPFAVELRHEIRRLAKHRVLKDKESVDYLEDEPPPRGRPDTTVKGKMIYPEQTLTEEELDTGVKAQDLSEVLATRDGPTQSHSGDGRPEERPKRGGGGGAVRPNGAGDRGHVYQGV